MRIIDQIPHEACRITLFEWNGKYLVKFERGFVELTYKVSQMEVSSVDELKVFIDDTFLKEALLQLNQMEETLGKSFERY